VIARGQGVRWTITCAHCTETFPVWLRGERGRVSWRQVLAAHVKRRHPMMVSAPFKVDEHRRAA